MAYSHLFIIFQPILADLNVYSAKFTTTMLSISHKSTFPSYQGIKTHMHDQRTYILASRTHKMCFCIPLHWFSTVFPCICALDGQVCCLRHLAYDTTLNKLLTRPFSFHSALRHTFLNTKTSSVWTAHKGKGLACTFTSCASDITKISTTVLILMMCV